MKKISFLRMLVISLLGFALTFSSNIQDPPLMTFKVRQLAPDLPNTTLGILGFIGLLVAMAVQPIVGVFSDRAHTKLGRRLPFIIGGAVLIAASLFLLVVRADVVGVAAGRDPDPVLLEHPAGTLAGAHPGSGARVPARKGFQPERR